MVDLSKNDTGAHFWILDPLPAYINVWVFKSNRIAANGKYISIQPYPSGVTLRYIVKGSWQVKMCGVKQTAKPGDIFCALPSEHIIFEQVDDCDWEWLEIQFNGSYAEKFIMEFGLSRKKLVITPSEPVKTMELFKKLYSLMAQNKRSIPEALALLFKLVETCSNNQTAYIEQADNSRKLLVTKAIDYLETMPSVGKNVSELAEQLGVDRTTLYRAFKEGTNQSPHKYIDRLKLERAEELLSSTNMTVAEVSRNSGFSDVKYFIGWFKKKKNTTPGSYKKRLMLSRQNLN